MQLLTEKTLSPFPTWLLFLRQGCSMGPMDGFQITLIVLQALSLLTFASVAYEYLRIRRKRSELWSTMHHAHGLRQGAGMVLITAYGIVTVVLGITFFLVLS
jgi:hypothetical protein